MRFGVSLLALAVLAGCGASPGTATLPGATALSGRAATDDVQRGNGDPQGSSFAIPSSPADGIVAGPDGRVWFGTFERPGSITESGSIAMLPQDPVYGQLTGGATRGPAGDKHVWFAEVDRFGEPAVARITPPHTVDVVRMDQPIKYVLGLAPGPDGAVYGAALNSIVRISADGTSVLNYPVPGQNGPNPLPQYPGRPISIALGPDGAMWFTMPPTTYVGRFDPVSKQFSSFLVPARNTGSIVAFGNAMYFTSADPGNDYYVGKIAMGGGYSRISLPGVAGHYLQSMTVGPDGNLWVGGSGALWNISPLGAVSGPFALLGVTTGPNYLAAGPDGNLWCLDGTPQAILVYQLHTLTVSSTSLLLETGETQALTASEASPAGSIGATSFATRVATVATTGPGAFQVTGVHPGSTTIRVSDGKHNFVDVRVSVSR